MKINTSEYFTVTGKINNNKIKSLTEQQKNEINSETKFCPEETSLAIRIKLINDNTINYPLCVVCQSPVRMHFKQLHLLSTCSKKCDYTLRVEKTKSSNLINYGVSSTNKIVSIKEKQKKSMIEKHGVSYYTISNLFNSKSAETKIIKYGNANFVNPKKGQETKLLKYGDMNYNNQEKFIDTCIEKYGVRHVMQNKEIFNRQQSNSYGGKKYKHLYYRGSYELHFITAFEKVSNIKHLANGPAVKYIKNGKTSLYFPDFIITNLNHIIEIKSSWTYDNNGTNDELKKINDLKWLAVKKIKGVEFTPLMSKKEIDLFLKILY